MTPGEIIRAKRQEAGLSVRSLAAKVDLSPTMMSNVERDRYKPGVNAAHRIFSALELHIVTREYIVDLWAADVYHHAELWHGVAGGSAP